jgi:16S rRNA (guanine527-N7)-methyltransferase
METGCEIILNYFPQLNDTQRQQLSSLKQLYAEWNEKINLISRKDIDNLYINHVLHSLGIAKVIEFKKNTHVLDVGTGGGFPGIPLAILFPEVQFNLVDSIGKKITVVQNIIQSLKLTNAIATKSRAEELKLKYDFIVSRAVTTLAEFCSWTMPLIKKESFNVLRNGILYLKGGDIKQEIAGMNKPVIVFELKNYFKEDYFETKKVVYISH